MIRGEQNVVVAIKYCDELDVGDMLYEKKEYVAKITYLFLISFSSSRFISA